MSVRVVKECLIAAADLNMIDGEYVFLAFEIDIARGIERQSLTFKWATADYGLFCFLFFWAVIKYSCYLARHMHSL